MARKKRRRSVHLCACEKCRHHPYSVVAKDHRAINRVLVALDERSRRLLMGLLALEWGRGGIQELAEITGLSRNTICRGREEIQQSIRLARVGRIRRPGGGRKRVEKNTRTL